jgi:hypothetical protein
MQMLSKPTEGTMELVDADRHVYRLTGAYSWVLKSSTFLFWSAPNESGRHAAHGKWCVSGDLGKARRAVDKQRERDADERSQPSEDDDIYAYVEEQLRLHNKTLFPTRPALAPCSPAAVQHTGAAEKAPSALRRLGSAAFTFAAGVASTAKKLSPKSGSSAGIPSPSALAALSPNS